MDTFNRRGTSGCLLIRVTTPRGALQEVPDPLMNMVQGESDIVGLSSHLELHMFQLLCSKQHTGLC